MLASVHIYPLKGCRAVDLEESVVEPWGLAGDPPDGYPTVRGAVPWETAELLKVTVWGSTVLAAAAGTEADAWFSEYLGEKARLVYLDDPTRRAVDPDYG